MAVEKYHRAARILASSPGRIKERLAVALSEIVDCRDGIPDGDEWDDVREMTLELWRRLNFQRSSDGEPGVQGRIESISEEEACEIADIIYTIENKLRET